MSDTESKEVKRYLREVKRELRDLGPFELRKALADIKADLVDFAMDGQSTPPSKEQLAEARRIMPSAHEVAQAYLASARPSKTAIRLSLLYNLLLFLGPLYLVAIMGQAFLPPSQPAFPSAWFFFALFLFVGVFGFFVYGLALLSPLRAERWRFAVLPVVTLTLVTDFILALIFMIPSQSFGILEFILPLAMLLCGIYSVGYAHTQIPRLVQDYPTARRGRDYFRTLNWQLRSLDRTNRLVIVAELNRHLEAAGVDLRELPVSARYSSAIKVLGSPEEVALGYVRDNKPKLTRWRKTALVLVFCVSMVGGALGSMLLLWLSSGLTYGPNNILPLGLLGSAGLVVLSIAGLACILHLKRVPLHWPDIGPPTIAIGLVCAISVAGVFGGLSQNNLAQPVTLTDYWIAAQHHSADGGLDIVWSAWDRSVSGLPFFPTGSEIFKEMRMTHLDSERNVVSSESFPPGFSSLPILALEHKGSIWAVLSASSFSTFGDIQNEKSLLSLPGYKFVIGGISGEWASIAWSNYTEDQASGNVTLSLRFNRFRWFGTPEEIMWTRTFKLLSNFSSLYTPKSLIAFNDNRVLIVHASREDNETRSQSSIYAFLLDTNGNNIANLTLSQNTVPRSGSQDNNNRTYAGITGIHNVPGGFWVIGGSIIYTNGIKNSTAWASRIEEFNGSTTKYEFLHFSQSNPIDILDQYSIFSGDRILVATHAWKIDDPINLTIGGLFLSNIFYRGGLDYTIRLDNSWIDKWPTWPILSGWNGTPIVLVPIFSSRYTESIRVRTYSVPGPSSQVVKGEMTVSVSEAALLYYYLVKLVGSVSTGAESNTDPSVVELVGEVFLVDYGLLEWRKNIGYTNLQTSFVSVPAVVSFDIQRGETKTVLLVQPDKIQDPLADLIFVFIATSLSVTALMIGYPRLRAWRILRKTKASTS